MKKIAYMTGCLALAGLVYLASLATAQNGAPNTGQPQSPSGTMATPSPVPVRVAVVNINKVLKLFNKAQVYNSTLSAKVQGVQSQLTAKREELTKLQADLAKAVDPAQKEQIEKQVLQVQRVMQDIDNEARKTIGQEQSTVAITIYKDIEGVIQRVAATNGFDLVLSYPDATTDAEMYSQANVVRKMASQAAIPIYYRPHIDLTDAVVKTLNAQFPMAAPATTGAPPVPGTITPTGATGPGVQPKKN